MLRSSPVKRSAGGLLCSIFRRNSLRETRHRTVKHFIRHFAYLTQKSSCFVRKEGKLSNALLKLLLQNTEFVACTNQKDFMLKAFAGKGGKMSRSVGAFLSEAAACPGGFRKENVQ